MSAERRCPGLPVDWLNAWLAAIGATMLVDGLGLRWTEQPRPVAVLVSPTGVDPADLLQQALPSAGDTGRWPIARELEGCERIGLNPSFEQFAQRAAIARADHDDGWMWSSCYTDLLMEKGTPTVDKGPFLPGMPGKANTVEDRLKKVIRALADARVEATLEGVGSRSQQFGLGFDVSRIGSLADETDPWIDPVIELLAFWGLRAFPVRGDLTQVRQRGWPGRRLQIGGFRWPAWVPSLDRWGIDALLDAWASPREGDARPIGVFASWETVPYEGLGTSDPTRGLGSRRSP